MPQGARGAYGARGAMRLSLKQKQVLGVTFMVALIVIALSLLHLVNTAGVLLAESRDRFELFGSAVYLAGGQRDRHRRRAPTATCAPAPTSSRRCRRRSIRRTSSTPSSSIRPAA